MGAKYPNMDNVRFLDGSFPEVDGVLFLGPHLGSILDALIFGNSQIIGIAITQRVHIPVEYMPGH